LVNWTDHGAAPVAGSNGEGIAKWATTSSWAPAAAWRTINGKDKFFLYFANNANGIGVLTSDSPTGPWIDPLKAPLVDRSTPGCSAAEVVWCFDPAVFIDDDGQAYLYFGGGIEGKPVADPGTARLAPLSGNMISLLEDPRPFSVPYFFEDSGMNKINGKYYYSWCTNWSSGGGLSNAAIAWMSGDTPTGPFSGAKQIMRNPSSVFGAGSTNHHAIFQFKDKWYMAYHAQKLEVLMLGSARGYRSSHIDEVTFAVNGDINVITPTMAGNSPVGNLNPYQPTPAVTIGTSAGIDTKFHKAANDEAEHMAVTAIQSGDWLALYGVDFGSGANKFSCRVTGPEAGFGVIQLRLDAPDGEIAGYAYIKLKQDGQPDTYSNLTVDLLKPVTGVHDLVFVFYGEGYEFDSWEFIK
jgi:arabinoxylan arabinofuranohydrolase